jgi:heat shock protein HslJ
LAATLLATLFLLSACGPATSPAPGGATAVPQAMATPEPSIPLEGTQWLLASLGGADPVAGSSPTLGFYPDNYLQGTAGCNSFGVDYTASGQGFHLAEIHRTDFQCEEPPGVMAQDRAFFEALSSIAAYRATTERLAFADAAGETVLVYAPKLPAMVDPALEGTEWLLISLEGGSLVADSRITLNLGKDGFQGVAGCNNYGGEYEAADEGTLKFGTFAVTAMDCPAPEGVMEQEQAYVAALTEARGYQLVDDRLEIQDAAGETILVYARKQAFATDPGALVGTAWRLASMSGEDYSVGPAFTLAFFSKEVLGGHAGCRDYLATYEASGDNLHLLFEAMFDAGCREEDALLGQESDFLGVMAPKADLRLGEGWLEIHGERGGLLVLEPLPEEANLDLEGPTWSLLASVGPNRHADEPEPWPVPNGPLAGTAIDLTFEGDAARGSAGCNRYGAAYARNESLLRFESMTFTERACLDPEGVMEQEAHYLALLAAVSGYQIYGDHLWLQTGDGQALVFWGD